MGFWGSQHYRQGKLLVFQVHIPNLWDKNSAEDLGRCSRGFMSPKIPIFRCKTYPKPSYINPFA